MLTDSYVSKRVSRLFRVLRPITCDRVIAETQQIRDQRESHLRKEVTMVIIGIIACSLFLVAIWRVNVKDEISNS